MKNLSLFSNSGVFLDPHSPDGYYTLGQLMLNHIKRFSIVMMILGLWLTSGAADDTPQNKVTPIPAAWTGIVTDAAQLPIEQNTWGTLQWVCNEKLMPGSALTVGLVTFLHGKGNPLHYHPNCEEVLYVITGQGLHSYDSRTIPLKAGMTIRIPANVKHNILNTGQETLRTLVSFSSGDRKTVFLEEQPAK